MTDFLRTKKTSKKFQKFKKAGFLANGCSLCKEKSIKKFKYWKITENNFPYDRIAKVNHILISKRHTVYEKLSIPERKELESIKRGYIQRKYQNMMEATQKSMSVPEHFHIHLVVLKK